MAKAWNEQMEGSHMFQVVGRNRNCRVELLKWKSEHHLNYGKAIREQKTKMEAMQNAGGARDWMEWKKLQQELGKEYRKEEVYWSQKSRVQWLQDGDQNSKFFHAYTMNRRRRNCIERLINDQGVDCNTSALLEEEITTSYQKLFTSSEPTN